MDIERVDCREPSQVAGAGSDGKPEPTSIVRVRSRTCLERLRGEILAIERRGAGEGEDDPQARRWFIEARRLNGVPDDLNEQGRRGDSVHPCGHSLQEPPAPAPSPAELHSRYPARDAPCLATGWPEIDASLGGFPLGGIHELFGVEWADPPPYEATSRAGTDARRGFRRWASRSVLRRWPFARSGVDVRRPAGATCPIAGSSGSDGRSDRMPMPCALRRIHGRRVHRMRHASIPHWPSDRSSSIPSRRSHRVIQVASPARSRFGSGRSSRRSVTRALPRSLPTVADSPQPSRAGCRSRRQDAVSPRLSSCCESLARSPREASRRSVGGSSHIRGIETPRTAGA
jgi:hypothetical protein